MAETRAPIEHCGAPSPSGRHHCVYFDGHAGGHGDGQGMGWPAADEIPTVVAADRVVPFQAWFSAPLLAWVEEEARVREVEPWEFVTDAVQAQREEQDRLQAALDANPALQQQLEESAASGPSGRLPRRRRHQ